MLLKEKEKTHDTNSADLAVAIQNNTDYTFFKIFGILLLIFITICIKILKIGVDEQFCLI